MNLIHLSGELSDNHDVVSVKVYELDVSEEQLKEDRSSIEPSSSYFEPPRDHVDDPKPSSMSGIKMFFLLLLGVLGCVACVVIGIMIYQKQQDNSRKRFYWPVRLSARADNKSAVINRKTQKVIVRIFFQVFNYYFPRSFVRYFASFFCEIQLVFFYPFQEEMPASNQHSKMSKSLLYHQDLVLFYPLIQCCDINVEIEINVSMKWKKVEQCKCAI